MYYDQVSADYRAHRRPDPRIQRAILEGLGPPGTLINVGAGAGSYEPTDRPVVALEPSRGMIRQRRSRVPVVQARAEQIPFPDNSFDQALAILTIHHWSDPERGLEELKRVARQRVVIVTWDPDFEDFWLYDYFPGILKHDRAIFPTTDSYQADRIDAIPIPADCTDGFLGAYWKRPHAYLDPDVRKAISTFSQLPNSEIESGAESLRADLESGGWHHKYPECARLDELKLGYLLVSIAPKG